jgi:hypothetical protein
MGAGGGALKPKLARFVPAMLNVPKLFETVKLAFWIPANSKTALRLSFEMLADVWRGGQVWHLPLMSGTSVAPHVPRATLG